MPLLFALVFASGVALAAFAGAVAAPISSVFPGMGNQILILCFVVVVIGGIGSINGALIASLAVGLADTLGKVLAAEYSGVAVYLVMAAILLWRPQGIANTSLTAVPHISLTARLCSLRSRCSCFVPARGHDILSPARRQNHDHGDLRA